MRFLATSQKAITLPEIVAVIVILGIAVGTLVALLGEVTQRVNFSEATALTTFYAQSLMEEVLSKQFDESASSFTDSADFGTEGTEDDADRDSFDDIDDYTTCTDTAVTSPAAGYTRAVSVEYARLVSNAWQGCGGSISCDDSETDCSQCDACCYKRITVTIDEADTNIQVELTSLLSSL